MQHGREILRDFRGWGPRPAWLLAALLPLAAAWWLGGWKPWHGYYGLLVASAMATHGALCIAHARLRWRNAFWVVAAIVFAASLVGGAIGTALMSVLGLAPGGAWRMQDAALGATFALLLAGPLVLARRTESLRQRAVEEAHERELQRQTQLKQVAELELKALQAQIEPHFLYNTLANVQHLLRNDPHDADRMLESLIRYLKSSLPQIRVPQSTVGEEIARVEAYLAIMQVRMQGRLRYAIDVPGELAHVPLPPLSLLTLVENAVKHGLEPKTTGGNIRLTGRADGDCAELCVADDGAGFTSETGGGVGLTNLRERLQALHGEAAALELSRAESGGVEARVRVPCQAPHPA